VAEEDRTRRWQRTEPIPRGADPLQALRSAIGKVRAAPADAEARRQLRALAAEHGMWDELAVLLSDEARAAGQPDVAAAFYEELADVHDNLDHPIETIAAMEAVVRLVPEDIEQLDRLAKLYHRAGAWSKAAEAFERVADLVPDDRGRAALRAAGRLYRDHGKADRAVDVYRAIVERRPSDSEAWRALDELLAQLGRWREVAEVRASLAERAANDVDKAVHLRGQARALEQLGDHATAAALVARAAKHAPENVSGLVDYAEVLAKSGKGREAVDLLGQRVTEAVQRGAPGQEIAALRLRVADMLDGACDDRAGAIAVLDELVAAMPEHAGARERLLRLASEAGRLLATSGDHRGAARMLEKASELSPEDDALRTELEDARTALLVERAGADAAAGDAAGAERKLRAILGTRPLHAPAVLALADVLQAGGRLDDAAHHLRDTLAAAPDDLAPERLAPIVFRYARVIAASGEADEAHQLLHEAHHLDRKDLRITLALGESCFARRLWREASLHLGRLAEHPDAPRHAKKVAAGLVHAAQAEVRALRPANAAKHYEAAVRIDPDCAKAWQALADAATERGDAPAAALALERVVASAAEPPSPAVLRKLYAMQRTLGRPRGETAARLAAVETDAKAMRELLAEAVESFTSTGEHARAREVAGRLAAAAPDDLDAIAIASRAAIDAGDRDAATAWLRRLLVKESAEVGGGIAEGARRAELWRRLGDLERSRGNAREALTAYQRAVLAAPDSDGALAARRGLVELAAKSGQPAAESLAALVESDPEAADVVAYARELERSRDVEDARAMFELADALGARLDEDDRKLVARNAPRALASDESYAYTLDEAERREAIDDEADRPLADLCELLGEAANLVCPDARTALVRAGFADLRRLPASRESAAAAMYPQIAKVLGGPATLLHEGPRGVETRLLVSAPPVVLLGPRLVAVRARSHSDLAPAASMIPADEDEDELETRPLGALPPHDAVAEEAELRFRLGRTVELSRPRRIFAVDREEFTVLVAALCQAFGRPELAASVRGRDANDAAGLAVHETAVRAQAKRVHDALPVALRRKIGELVANLDRVDPEGYVAACDRAADRAGLLVCGDTRVAIRVAGGPAAAPHLARFAASAKYLALRRKLRGKRRNPGT
jgi:tetratricopeptide (TPR) repeat protein